VVEFKARSEKIYLPLGDTWKNAWTEQIYPGGQWVTVDAPLELIPLFLRGDCQLPIRNQQGEKNEQ